MNHNLRTISIALLLFLVEISEPIFAQTYSSKNKKAVKAYQAAVSNFESRHYDLFFANIDEAVKYDNLFIEPYLLAMQACIENREVSRAIVYGEHAFAINPKFFKNLSASLGGLYLAQGNYDMAITYYDFFVRNYPADGFKVDKPQRRAYFAKQLMDNPVDFIPINLGDSINTQYDDYWPSISGDGQILVKTTNLPSKNQFRPYQEDFFESKRLPDGTWAKSHLLEGDINTTNNEGAQSLTADGRAMYFTRCTTECDIYYSSFADGMWNEPIRLDSPINSGMSEKQPSVSSDGRYLYFTSNRAGGYGGYDLYVAVRDDTTGEWAEVRNLGPAINTEGNDVAPFIHFDGRTLYFASDGHMGLGNLDIFVSKQNDKGEWEAPQNLGYPINTRGEEQGIVVAADAHTAYFASRREGSRGLDIYTFEMPEALRPASTSYIKGTVIDAQTRLPILANVMLGNLSNANTDFLCRTNPDDGTFFTSLPTKQSYAMQVRKPGYLFYSKSFMLDSMHTVQQPLELLVELQPLKVGSTAVLRNVYFDFDSATIRNESEFELNQLVQMLKNRPTLWIEVGGYTDNVGSEEYNMQLSTSRARAVVDYLISKGIQSNRLRAVGYGSKNPLDTNDTDDGRAKNRRTEFKVLYL